MSESLQGTVALITGASSGIGYAVALRLATAGASIAIVARRRDKLEELASKIGATGSKVLIIEADLVDPAQAAAAVANTVTEFGRLDTVVNSAGVMLNGDSLTTPMADWELMVDLNLKALMYVTKAALPHLIRDVETSPRHVADVVNISSIAGRVARRHVAIYNATKFGVTAATEAWRQEYTRQSVRFSVVEPGAVETELFDHQSSITQEAYRKMFSDVEKLHAADIAEATAFIVTNPRRVAVNEIVIRPTDQV
ncbi:SDR family NAD(P)-dependent oxidoreductase [Paraburkholderia sp. BCC1884]|uniref:SDR family NAD(P)-dependent oxidoreductase n=1 Tax=Paraburkholderia sp. BCC1884 TaxID=2562668 RepID=UPI0011831993|nr:SDR family NAD(P)-dependent oxidoreductase [Paraburkholderia sp. BCC1884]